MSATATPDGGGVGGGVELEFSPEEEGKKEEKKERESRENQGKGASLKPPGLNLLV